VHVLMLMGHGDNLVICDVNHPAATIAAKTTYGRLIDLGDCNLPTAAVAILSLLPLDGVVAEPVIRMQVVGDSAGAALIFARMQGVFDRAEGWAVKVQAVEEFRLLQRRKPGVCDRPDCGFRTLRLFHPDEGCGEPARVAKVGCVLARTFAADQRCVQARTLERVAFNRLHILRP
jgi:L-fucose mutarotase